jgi:hypothetical protein
MTLAATRYTKLSLAKILCWLFPNTISFIVQEEMVWGTRRTVDR